MSTWQVDDRVKMLKGTAKGCSGTVRAIFTQKSTTWIGVELDQAKGKHDGRAADGRYHFRYALKIPIISSLIHCF